MAISFDCEGCGKSYTVGDHLAGKFGQCKQCGRQMTIPEGRDDEGYGLNPAEAEAEVAPLPPRAPSPSASPGPGPKPGSFAFGSNELKGLAVGLLVVAAVAFKVYHRWERIRGRGPAGGWNRPAPPAPGGPAFDARPRLADDRPEGPIEVQSLPERGPGREVDPGVVLHEVALGPPGDPAAAPPGHGGKLWLYLPAGEHPARSLPCILIAGAGSNLISGMDLGDGDRPEHLPYARAGFAVLAFELDGKLPGQGRAADREVLEAASRFQRARAGLVNARIALEYALARVPEVDPGRISSAGHSSAGTLSLLVAAVEPRLRSSVAFAPVPDLEESFGPQAVGALRRAGLGDLVGRYSPKNREAKLDRPLFLFYAKDDPKSGQLDAFADRLRSAGKPVTVETVPAGGHYEPMIDRGIPAAIEWLRGQDRGGR